MHVFVRRRSSFSVGGRFRIAHKLLAHPYFDQTANFFPYFNHLGLLVGLVYKGCSGVSSSYKGFDLWGIARVFGAEEIFDLVIF